MKRTAAKAGSHSTSALSAYAASYRYQVAIACMFRNATFFLREWIEFHLMLGVEKFFLCDNNSEDDCATALAPYVRAGVVDLERESKVFDKRWDNFEKKLHAPFYNRVVRQVRGVVKWLCLIDVDEFMVPHEGAHTIGQVLEEVGATYGPVVPVFWQRFGTAGVQRVPCDRLIIETLTMRERNDAHSLTSVHMGKAIVRPEMVKHVKNPHWIVTQPQQGHRPLGIIAVTDASMLPFMFSVNRWLRIYHYTMGDLEYVNLVKLQFHRRYYMSETLCDVSYERYAALYNDEHDFSMVRFVPALRARIFGEVGTQGASTEQACVRSARPEWDAFVAARRQQAALGVAANEKGLQQSPTDRRPFAHRHRPPPDSAGQPQAPPPAADGPADHSLTPQKKTCNGR